MKRSNRAALFNSRITMDVIQKVFSWCERAYEGIEECSSR